MTVNHLHSLSYPAIAPAGLGNFKKTGQQPDRFLPRQVSQPGRLAAIGQMTDSGRFLQRPASVSMGIAHHRYACGARGLESSNARISPYVAYDYLPHPDELFRPIRCPTLKPITPRCAYSTL
ncbi:hypothetical protein [Paraburkholderia caballeronis]|uniref:hypothetical protein n=1 Tax=Paraburkholderia caballeronis TaxID=416943 RepID=UPI001416F9C5|nr:hypothetical protein [Paraburkholderia caballeronis]